MSASCRASRSGRARRRSSRSRSTQRARLCDTDGPSTNCSVASGGYTSIQDIHVDPWTGKTYVYELAAGGALEFEEGFETGVFPPAVLLEVRNGQRRELAAGQLSQPGGVTTGLFGQVYVTDGMFTDGRLLQIKS